MLLTLWDIARNKVERKAVSQTRWKVDACPMTYYSIVPNGSGYLAVWPTRKQVFYSRLDGDGNLLTPGEIPTSGTSGMRTGLLALANRRGQHLVAWNSESQIGWQLYDARGQAMGGPERTAYRGKGIAGFVASDDQFVLVK